MSNKRYYLLCLLSGCIWAFVAYVLCSSGVYKYKGSVLGGIVASPIIGVIVGFWYYPAYKFNLFGRILASLATLYVGAVLFGLSVGICEALVLMISPVSSYLNVNFFALVLQAINVTLWGLTATGIFIILWPLVFLNHWLLGRSCVVS